MAQTEGHAEGRPRSAASISSDESDNHEHIWSHPTELLIAYTSSIVGEGSIFYFPALVYRNGGVAYFIPYLTALVCVGWPITFFELAVGQFTGKTTVWIWKCLPLFEGVGYGKLVNIYHTFIATTPTLSIYLFYLIMSIKPVLPWTVCGQEWADCNCYAPSCLGDACGEGGHFQYYCQNETVITYETAATQYNKNYVFRRTGLFSELFYDWRMALALFFIWILITYLTIGGLKAVGWLSYFLIVFPNITLLLLTLGASFLPGAGQGVIALFEPTWGKLLEVQVWWSAAQQVVFPLMIGYGTLTDLGCFNKFNHNCYRDSLLVALFGFFINMLIAIFVFCLLGAEAVALDVDISTLVKTGIDLAFVTVPEAIAADFYLPHIWTFLFFAMLLSVSVGTVLIEFSTFVHAMKRQLVYFRLGQILIFCTVVSYISSLIFIARTGEFVKYLLLVAVKFSRNLVSLAETAGFMWLYGSRNFIYDVSFMLNKKLGIYWFITWSLVMPIFFLLMVVDYLLKFGRITYMGYKYPLWANLVTVSLVFCVVALIVIIGILKIRQQHGENTIEKISNSLRPAPDWGPREMKPKWREGMRRRRTEENNAI